MGYDFVGPRISLDVGYGQLPLNFSLPGTALNGKAGQLTGLINLYYDFFPTSTITPYIGAGAGIAFIDSNSSLGSTQFAWDALLGVRYNVDNALGLNLEARYVGTTNPSVNFNGQTFTGQNQNIVFLAGVTYKFGQPQPAPPPPPPPPAAAPSYMVFFDWDRSNLSDQALNTIRQAAGAYKTKGSARITATGHTDTSGPEAYNMALSLRRANTVKDALVREGVPATAIAVIGRGESQPPGADRGRRARAAEPPRRDRHPVRGRSEAARSTRSGGSIAASWVSSCLVGCATDRDCVAGPDPELSMRSPASPGRMLVRASGIAEASASRRLPMPTRVSSRAAKDL